MQHTTLPDSDTTGRTGHGGYLFGREFALFHFDRLRLHVVANLCNFAHCPRFFLAQTPIPGRVRLRRGGAVVPRDDGYD